MRACIGAGVLVYREVRACCGVGTYEVTTQSSMAGVQESNMPLDRDLRELIMGVEQRWLLCVVICR